MHFSDAKLLDHPLVQKAFEVAEERHRGQHRGTSAGRPQPYIHHPVKVAEILENTLDEYNPVLIAAGLTHDLIEDTGTTKQDLRALLGDAVADLVSEVSLDRELKGVARRNFQVAQIERASLNAQRLKVADRVVNLLSLAFDPPDSWSIVNRFNYLQSSKEMIEKAAIPDARLRDIAQEALELAERAVFVAIRERVTKKGISPQYWRGAVDGIDDFLAPAQHDIEINKTLYDAEGKPQQPLDGADPADGEAALDALYAEAALAQRELGSVVRGIAEFMNVEAVVPDKLKERGRAREVIGCRHNGDPRYLHDIARVSLVCDTMDQAGYALHAISQSYKIAEIHDRFNNPPVSAYRDMRLVLRSDRSHFCEIQIHLRHLWDAKKYKGDEIYHETRALSAIAPAERTAEQKKRLRTLYDESRTLYKEAAERHGFTDHKPTEGYKPFRPGSSRLPDELIGCSKGGAVAPAASNQPGVSI